jgi:hypothetical protein
LLGGQGGPLRTLTRISGYIALFFIGYAIVLGLKYAVVASAGMGIILALELRLAATQAPIKHDGISGAITFGFFRGVVLALASMTIAEVLFGVVFGLLSRIGLSVSYLAGFSPSADFEAHARPRLTGYKILASILRAIIVSVAAIIAGMSNSRDIQRLLFGLKLGMAAGIVSASVDLFSPAIEWWIENLPERRLGVLGLALILLGVGLQSIQYWLVVLNIHVF